MDDQRIRDDVIFWFCNDNIKNMTCSMGWFGYKLNKIQPLKNGVKLLGSRQVGFIKMEVKIAENDKLSVFFSIGVEELFPNLSRTPSL